MIIKITDETQKCMKLTFKNNQVLYQLGDSYEDIQEKLGIYEPYEYTGPESKKTVEAHTKGALMFMNLPILDVCICTVKEALSAKKNKKPEDIIEIGF